MRTTGPLLALSLLAVVGCGGDGSVSSVDGERTSTTLSQPGTADTTSPATTAPGVDTTIAAPPPTKVSTTVATSDPVTTTTVPGQRPGTNTSTTGLSIEAALLPDEAFPPPWELQRRTTDGSTFDIGPNQTDCKPYTVVEHLRAGGEGHVMWWIDGGNANQYVRRTVPPYEDLAVLVQLADACPTVRWNEGGGFTVQRIDLADGLGFRFDDRDTDERTWLAVTTEGDLTSVLEVPTWTDIDGNLPDFDAADLDRLATDMYARLQSAPVVPIEPSTTATTTGPTTLPATTTTTTIVAEDALADALLGDGDLPSGWVPGDIVRHRPAPGDDVLVEVCPPASAFDDIDQLLQWTRSSTGPGGGELDQVIGRAGSAGRAADLVRRFGGVGDCDLSRGFGAEVVSSGGVIDVAGADAASTLRIELPEEGFVGELVMTAVGDVVTFVSLGVDDPAATTPLDLVAISELTVARIADG